MNLALRKLAGLFVDDGRFALAVIVWLVIGALLIRYLNVPAPYLFVGLAIILMDSVRKAARRR